MRILFFIMFILFLGNGITMNAISAIQQIVVYLSYLIGAIFFVGAGIIEAIDSLKKQIKEEK